MEPREFYLTMAQCRDELFKGDFLKAVDLLVQLPSEVQVTIATWALVALPPDKRNDLASHRPFQELVLRHSHYFLPRLRGVTYEIT